MVQHNINRLGKTLRTESGPGDRVGFYLAETGEEEADFVLRHMARKGYSPAQVAVLYRTNNQARLIEEALRAKDIHYTVVGGIKFYSRKEIKDVLAYLRVLANPNDDEALRRIINVPRAASARPPRSAWRSTPSSASAPCCRSCAIPSSTKPYRGARARPPTNSSTSSTTSPWTRRNWTSATWSKTARRNRLPRLHPAERRGLPHAPRIAGRIRRLLPHARREGRARPPAVSAGLSLIADVDTWDSNVPAVTLMTIHSAKGLEFDYVYLIGLEGASCPSASISARRTTWRRSAYSLRGHDARAQGLVLSAATSRMLYGRTHPNRTVSRFVGEAGRNRLEQLNTRTAAPV